MTLHLTCLLELDVCDNYNYFILISSYEAPIKHLILTTTYEIGIIIISALQMVKLRQREVKIQSLERGRHGVPRGQQGSATSEVSTWYWVELSTK